MDPGSGLPSCLPQHSREQQASFSMARRDRSRSPDSTNKRVRPSYRSSRSPSPTRRSQRPQDRRHDDRDRDRDRARDKDRDRERDRDKDRRDERYRDERRRDERRRSRSRSRDRRDHRDRRSRSRSRDRKAPIPAATPLESHDNSASASPAPEDDKIKARRAKLAAWKQQQKGDKKALDDAKARVMLLAGKAPLPPGEYFHVAPLAMLDFIYLGLFYSRWQTCRRTRSCCV